MDVKALNIHRQMDFKLFELARKDSDGAASAASLALFFHSWGAAWGPWARAARE